MKPIRKIAVIGAGPSAAGFAKALMKEGNFEKIDLFERRASLGGLWNFSKNKANDLNSVELPSTPFLNGKSSPYETPLQAGDQFVWPSPIYKDLDTNIPKDLMAYNNCPFDESLPLYPKHKDVLEYLCNYSKEIEHLVQFNTKVVKIEFVSKKLGSSFKEAVEQGKIKYLNDISFDDYCWKVVSRPVISQTNGGLTPCAEHPDKTELYDAVAVASGNYDIPFIPNFPGLNQWADENPDSVLHAKYYNSFQDFSGSDKILIVGNSASGADIAFQLAVKMNIPIYKSKRSENLQPAGSHPMVKDLPNIKRFLPQTKEIEFVDGSVVDGFTKIIFATGYLKSFPFLEDLSVPFLPGFKNTEDSIKANKIQPLVSSGFKINGLYQHLLSYQYPGLAVIGAPKYVLPTRLSESQGAWLSRVWSNKIKLPSQDEMKQWELDRYNTVDGNDYRFHSIPYPLDVEYYTFLNNQTLSAGENGLIPVLWDERQKKIRENAKKIKEAYIAYKKENNGKVVYSLKELEDSGYLELD